MQTKCLKETCCIQRPLWRHQHRWRGTVEIHLKGVWWEDVDWITLPQVRVQWSSVLKIVTKLEVPILQDGEFLTSWVTISFTRTILHTIIQSGKLHGSKYNNNNNIRCNRHPLHNSLWLVDERYSARISAGTLPILIEVLRGFSQSFQANPG